MSFDYHPRYGQEIAARWRDCFDEREKIDLQLYKDTVELKIQLKSQLKNKNLNFVVINVVKEALEEFSKLLTEGKGKKFTKWIKAKKRAKEFNAFYELIEIFLKIKDITFFIHKKDFKKYKFSEIENYISSKNKEILVHERDLKILTSKKDLKILTPKNDLKLRKLLPLNTIKKLNLLDEEILRSNLEMLKKEKEFLEADLLAENNDDLLAENNNDEDNSIQNIEVGLFDD